MRMLTTARSCWLERVTMLELPVETRLCGTWALAFIRARVIAPDGRGTLERSGWLTPYALEEIAQHARRAGSSWLEVAPRDDGPGLSAVWKQRALGRPGYLRELPPGGRGGPPVARRH